MISGKQPQLLEVFNACAVLVDEATIELTEQEMSFRGMDPSHIALLDIHIPNTDFATYEVKSAVKFGVRTDEAAKILKRFGKADIVKLELADNMLVLSNESKTFKIRLLEVSASNTPMPKLNLTTIKVMGGDLLVRTLADITAVAKSITLEKKGDKFTAFGRGDSGECTLGLGLANGEDSKATYSLDYLTKIVKAVSADMVTLEYSSKMPLKLTMGHIAYYLAPRIQD